MPFAFSNHFYIRPINRTAKYIAAKLLSALSFAVDFKQRIHIYRINKSQINSTTHTNKSDGKEYRRKVAERSMLCLCF
jgi:hypothetical protein